MSATGMDQFTLLGDEFIRRDPTSFFATVARELRTAGLPPGEWFDEEGDFRFRYWKFVREVCLWRVTTTSHSLPRPVAEQFQGRHKGLNLKTDSINEFIATSPSMLKAFVELLRSLPEAVC